MIAALSSLSRFSFLSPSLVSRTAAVVPKRRYVTLAEEGEVPQKLEDLHNRIFQIENSRDSDIYRYSFAAVGAGVAAAFGAGYINRRIDDTKEELKEKIGDLSHNMEKRIDLMEKNILDKLNISERVSRLEDR